MTPTEQDKELREAIIKIVESEYKSPNYIPAVERIDHIMKLITADRKRVALEARIDEIKKIEIGGDKIWTVDSGTDTAMLIEEHIAELKAQQEAEL